MNLKLLLSSLILTASHFPILSPYAFGGDDGEKPTKTQEDEKRAKKGILEEEDLEKTVHFKQAIVKRRTLEAIKKNQRGESVGNSRIKKIREFQKNNVREKSFTNIDFGEFSSKNLSREDVRKILDQHYTHISSLYDETKTFTGKILKGDNGGNTEFLYAVRDDRNNLILIFKGISSGDQGKELTQLTMINRHERLSSLPLDGDFPILAWPETLGSYSVSGTNKPADMCVINGARGEQLADLVKDPKNKPKLQEIFYAIGVAMASLDQHLAGVSAHSELDEVNKALSMSHEDLHWTNIFVHGKPKSLENHPIQNMKNPYRIYLIDNESFMNSAEMSMYEPISSNLLHGPDQEPHIDRIGGRLYLFYGWSLLAQKKIDQLNHISSQEWVSIFHDGFINGYASKYENKAAVRKFLTEKVIHINDIYLGTLEGSYREGKVIPYMERALYDRFRSFFPNQVIVGKIKGINAELKKLLIHH